MLRGLLKDLEDGCTKTPRKKSQRENDVREPIRATNRSPEDDIATVHKDALKQQLINYDIHGFPLHIMPHETSPASLEELVLRTRIADDLSDDVQFAVASHVVSYDVDFVCSIWVYLAVLKKKT